MIKFRQKNFILPALPAIINGAVAVGTGVSIKQSADKAKQDAEAAEQAARDNARMTKALDNIAKNASSGSTAAEQVHAVISSGGQRSYSKFAGLKAAGNVTMDLLKKNKNTLIGGTLAGVGIGTVGYATDKAIQADMKKSGIPIPISKKPEQEERQFTGKAGLVSRVGNALWQGAKKNAPMIALSSSLAAMPAVSYIAQKKQLKDQVNNTEDTEPTQTQYSKFSQVPKIFRHLKIGLHKTGKSMKSGWGNFKAAPVKSTLSGVSNLAGGGGLKGVSKFGDDLIASSKTHGFTGGEKLGNFIKNNPKTALAASIPVGVGVMAGTWDAGQKLTESAFKKVDKNAFKYRDSQQTEIQ